MSPRLDALLDAFRLAERPAPHDLASAIRGLPEPGALPSPWETWTLIGLVRHRERQLWVGDIVRTRLSGDPREQADRGSLGQSDVGIPQYGPVPGMPKWEYYFHGPGCCLTHNVDGQAIDVDFWEDSGEYFDTYFYERYLESLRQIEAPEQRLMTLHLSASTVAIGVDHLIDDGALTPRSEQSSHPYRVADAILDSQDAISAFCRAWENPQRRLWLSSLIGDWPAAHEFAAAAPDLQTLITLRAEQCRQIRLERLQRDLKAEHRGAVALQAIADLEAIGHRQTTHLIGFLEEALEEPFTAKTSAALKIIARDDSNRWCHPVYRVFSRVDPGGQIPQPYIWITSLKYLMRHGYRTRELLDSLANAGGTAIGEAVVLALEHAPELAIPLIRKGLTSGIRVNRTEIAAILALFDAPWSRKELLNALQSSDDQEATADTRAALLESSDEAAQQAVLAWEERNPHENETGKYLQIGGLRLGPFYTTEENAHKDGSSRLRYEMDELYDQVAKLKNVIPPEPSPNRPWWRFWRR